VLHQPSWRPMMRLSRRWQVVWLLLVQCTAVLGGFGLYCGFPVRVIISHTDSHGSLSHARQAERLTCMCGWGTCADALPVNWVLNLLVPEWGCVRSDWEWVKDLLAWDCSVVARYASVALVWRRLRHQRAYREERLCVPSARETDGQHPTTADRPSHNNYACIWWS